MRLIDADALIKKHPEICSRDMKFNLDLAPTIDVLQLARELKHHCKKQTTCSECEFYGGGYGYICRIAPEVDSTAPADWKIPKGG